MVLCAVFYVVVCFTSYCSTLSCIMYNCTRKEVACSLVELHVHQEAPV